METNTLSHTRGNRIPPRRDTTQLERSAIARATPEFAPESVATQPPIADEAFTARLLRDAVREAGLFQRSVLGHLDHKEWRDRVRADGQRLVDLLAQIGFQPSGRR